MEDKKYNVKSVMGLAWKMKLKISNWHTIIILCIFVIFMQNDSVIGQDVGGFTYPVWSPDSEYIAFASISNIGEYEIILLATDNWTTQSLTSEANEGYIEDIKWSPDGSYLAYTVITENKLDIWITPVFEGQSFNLTENIGGVSRNPAWSQDSTRITFTNRTHESDYLLSQIWMIDIDTMDAVQLTSDSGCYTDLQWIMNDNAILFVSLGCLGREEGLYRYDFNNMEEVPISFGSIEGYAVSPFDEYITLATLQPRSLILTDLILLNNENFEELATDFRFILDLSWSPNGEYLVMSTLCNDGSKIVSLYVESRELSDVTSCTNSVFSSSPSWSPNSSSIVYQSNGDIWLYYLTTGEYINLTEDL